MHAVLQGLVQAIVLGKPVKQKAKDASNRITKILNSPTT